jgi:hypothetical protein
MRIEIDLPETLLRQVEIRSMAGTGASLVDGAVCIEYV